MFYAVNFFDSVFSFLSGLWEGLTVFVNYLVTTISNIVSALAYVLSMSPVILGIVGFVPPLIGGACFAVIAVALVRFLLLK